MKKNLLGFTLLVSALFVIALSANAVSESAPLDNKTAAEKLGWVTVPFSENICCGYYQDPLIGLIDAQLPPLSTTTVEINADQTIFHQTGPSILVGGVKVSQPGRTVNADRAYLNRDPKTGKLDSADLVGNVILREPGKYITGDTGHIELHTRVANLMHAIYRDLLADPYNTLTKPTAAGGTPPLNAWGTADVVKQKASGVIELIKTTYSTCAPTTNTWQVSAEKIDLDHQTGRGTAYNSWLDLKGVPIFYTPYFNFPIDNRRESGFLFPYFGSSTNSGISLGIPYYWNIAPNYDATITPQIFSRRGLLTNGLFRYLSKSSSGAFSGGFIPNDTYFQQFKDISAGKYPVGYPALGRLENSSNNRYAFNWQDNTNFSPRWNGSINYNSVSDDYYQEDFDSASTLVSNQLPRIGIINYSGDVWDFTGQMSSYQTLHPINMAAVSNTYNMYPSLALNGNWPDEGLGLQYQLNNSFVYFERSQNPGETILPPSAGRTNVQPSVSWPITGMPGYITPNLQLMLTHYNVGSQVAGFSPVIQRNEPIFDVDSGLYFDRDVTFDQVGYQQTLEPRLFFLYVPYRNQNDIPLFDSGSIPFSYDSLFLTNRFSGLDRIGDADQVTFALTTRFLDQESNAEKFRASIGEIYYFRNRQVQLCNPGAICSTTTIISASALSPTEKSSPIAGELNYNFFPNWSVGADGSWDPHSHETMYGSANVHYQPGLNRILNFGYNFIRLGDPLGVPVNGPIIPPQSHQNDLNQASVSFAWPVRENWSVVGGYAYNLSHQYPQNYFYGLEYDTCCWAVRLVSGRGFNGLNQNNNPTFTTTTYIQWMFKGLATVGNQDPTSQLMGNIPGYQNTFQPFYGLKT